MSLVARRNLEGRLALEWGRLDDGRLSAGLVVPCFGGWMAYVLLGREAGRG